MYLCGYAIFRAQHFLLGLQSIEHEKLYIGYHLGLMTLLTIKLKVCFVGLCAKVWCRLFWKLPVYWVYEESPRACVAAWAVTFTNLVWSLLTKVDYFRVIHQSSIQHCSEWAAAQPGDVALALALPHCPWLRKVNTLTDSPTMSQRGSVIPLQGPFSSSLTNTLKIRSDVCFEVVTLWLGKPHICLLM